MANLSIGSNGSDTKKLQQALMDLGYNVGSTGADGVFGPNTEAAVRKYQEDNGLAVDGIAGKNTLGKLYGNKNTGTTAPAVTPATNTAAATTTNTQATAPTTTKPTTPEPVAFDYPDLAMSDDYNTAMEMLAQNEAARPGEYSPVYDGEIADYRSKIENRAPFSYDFNDDALYQQYKDQYIQQGKLAMEDTMGQAAAMTGGYSNSYAQSVGQQIYNQYLGKINEVGLELYDRAYDRYAQEGQQMQNMLGLYMDLEAQERANHQTELDNWYKENTRLQGNVDSIYAKEYNEWDAGRETAWNEFLLEREDMTAAKSDLITLMTATGHNPTDEELAAAGMTSEQANSYVNAYKESKNASSSSGKEKAYREMDIQAVQKVFEECTTVEEIDYLASIYKAEGYNPETISIYASRAAAHLDEDESDSSSAGSYIDKVRNVVFDPLTNPKKR